jgi:hypothetical protein
MKKVEKVVKIFKNPKLAKALLRHSYQGYLDDVGWISSFVQKEPVDKNGGPLPWVTYPYIHFVMPRITKEMTVFEFGSGSSTNFYAGKCKNVVSVEHDQRWYELIKSVVPSNSDLIYEKLEKNGDYARAASRTGKKFDLIIVDGRDRVNCIKYSLDSLSDKGALVLDDSEREKYCPGVDFLQEQGFRALDFWGISPGLFYLKCTSIYYRDGNLLGI